MALPRNDDYASYIGDDSDIETDLEEDGGEDSDLNNSEVADSYDDESENTDSVEVVEWDEDALDPESDGNEGEAGTEQETEPDVDPVPMPETTYKTVSIRTRVILENYDPAHLRTLYEQGCKFFVRYTDMTLEEISWDEIVPPKRTSTTTVTIEASNIGAASGQHFWDDDNGAHVTDDDKKAWLAQYDLPDHGSLLNPTELKPWHNILMNSLGILLRRGLINMVSVSKSAIAFYDGSGNNVDNVLAIFGKQSIQMGPSEGKHIIIDSEGITAYDGDQITALQASNIAADEARITQIEASYVHATDGIIDNATIDYANINGLTANYAHITDGVIDNANIGVANVDGLNAQYAHITDGIIDNAAIDHADVNGLTANYAHLTNGSIDNADISVAKVTGLNAQYAHITDGVIDNADIDQADVRNLDAHYAHISNGTIDNAKIGHADVSGLSANYAHIASGKIDNATIDAAKVNNLDTTYAKIDMANVNNAWVQNGVIKDGSISNAMIHDVSANKLTAGTIDASKITVTNLTAEDISVSRINGQTVTGKTIVDALSQHESDISGLDNRIDDEVEALNNRIDGAIETFTGTAIPTLNNYPASSWTTAEDRKKHVGDVYFVVNSQSQQNGYNYRFTQNGNDFSWQLIKDSDVTNALSRLTAAEGKINTFDSDISQLKTDTGILTTKTENLETSLGDKVSTATFNELSDTVEGHSRTIAQHTTAINNKADGSTVTALTNRVSKTEQDITGMNTTISDLSDTVEKKADGSTVTTLSSRVNSISDTVEGHTEQLSTITNTQTSIQRNAIKSTIQLWFTKADTTAPAKPTAHIATNDATKPNQWNVAVPTYNASYPNYYYCYEYQYVDGSYGWSSVTRDIATGESQLTARTAQNTANKNVKEAVQLWFTKADTTAPAKPTAAVTVNDASKGNQWNLAVPTYNTSYPHYFYCMQYKLADGTHTWSEVIYDRATTEAQSVARTTAGNLTTLQNDYATFKQTTENFESTVGSTYATKTELKTIDFDVDNLLCNSRAMYYGPSSNATIGQWRPAGSTQGTKTRIELDDGPYGPCGAIQIVGTRTDTTDSDCIGIDYFQFPENDEIYEMSLYARCLEGTGKAGILTEGYGKTLVDAGNTTSKWGVYSVAELSSVWKRIWVRFKIATQSNNIYIGVAGTDATIQMCMVRIIKASAAQSSLAAIDSRVTTAETSITQNKEDIALKANASDVYTKSGVDGLISTEVSNRNAAINTSAEAITASVASTYTTKTEFNNLESGHPGCWRIDRFTRPARFTSASIIPVHEDFIDANFIETIYKPDPGNNSNWNLGEYYIAKVRTYVKVSAATSLEVAYSSDDAVGLYLNDELVASYTAVASGRAVTLNLIAGWNKIEFLLNEQTGSDYAVFTTKTSTWTNVTAQVANLEAYETEYSRAELKVMSDNISSKVEKNGVISTINQSAETIKIAASKVDIEGAAIFSSGGALNKVVSSTQTEWYSSTSATSKDGGSWATTQPSVVAGRFIWERQKITYSNGTSEYKPSAEGVCVQGQTNLSGYSTTAQMNTAIGTAKSEAISTAAQDATDKVNAIEIGGRNLLINTGDYASWDSIAGEEHLTRTDSYIKFSPTSTREWWTIEPHEAYIPIENWDVNSKYTVSVDVKIDNLIDSGTRYPYIDIITVSDKQIAYTKRVDSFSVSVSPNTSGEWIHFEYSFNGDYSGWRHDNTSGVRTYVKCCVWLYVNSSQLDAVYIRNLKLEKGTKATDWTPAPEDVESAIDQANALATTANNTANAAAPKTAAVSEEQYIYISKASGTASVTANNTWVTANSDSQNTWTTKRPTYNSNYPVLFIAKQRKTVSGTITCTTPVKDDTTTVIDGGHITTGTIDASKATITNINASNITSGTLSADRIAAGTIAVGKLDTATQTKITNGDAAKTAFDNLVIGGTNIVREKPTTTASTSYMCYVIPTTIALKDLPVGTQLTIQLWDVVVDANSSGVGVWWGGGNVGLTGWIKPDVNGYVCKTYTLTASHQQHATASNHTIEIYNGISGHSNMSCTVGKWKIEVGNKPTSWSPAPEDVESAIDTKANSSDVYTKTQADGRFYNEQVITSSTTDKDLNNYTTTGIYHCATSMTNAPLTNHGTVIVEWNVGTQYQEYHPDNCTYYYKRLYRSSAWEAWTMIDAVGAYSLANAAAPKTSAIAEEQRIYYRSNSATAPTSGPTTWVTATGNSNATWVVKRIPNIDSSNTAYKYLYTCIQKKTVSGTITCSTILLDDSVTVIDGGNIITGSVAANQIAANAITAAKIATGAITTDKVAANAITADKIVASGLSIGYSQITNTPTIPSKTSQLTNDSNYVNTTQLATKSDKTIPDTRDDNQPPSWYFTNYPRQRVTEFKFANKIGIGSSAVYCSLETVVPWADASGGYPVQYATVSGVRYYRVGTADSTWSAWTQEETTTGAQNKANDAVDSLNIGGRNLYLHTGSIDFFTIAERRPYPSTFTSEIYTDAAFPGFAILRIARPNDTSEGGVYSYPNRSCTVAGELETGETYTLSFMTKASDDGVRFVSVAESQTVISSSSSSLTTEWQKYWVTFIVNSPKQAIVFYTAGTANAYVYVTQLKLEKGNKATDWTPAPEDVDSAIAAVETTANTANSKSVSFRGVNSVAAGTAAKTVTCAGFSLTQGYSITVYNSTANTVAGALTLNVNGTGAKNIWVAGAVTSDTNRLLWTAGSIITFVYDGTQFRVADNPGAWYGSTCSIAEDTAAKTTTINDAVIFKGATVTVPMSYSNTATAATLNVTSLGASSIYYGSGTIIPTKSNGFAWPAGAAVIFTYDGKFWRTGNQTFIDGGNILTGTIAADRIKANVISAVNNGTGTINADKINASSLSIGYSQITGTPTIPSKVSDLSDASSYSTTAQADAKYDAKGTASSVTGKYITAINDDGIRIHALNNAQTNYTKITADGFDVYKDGTSVAFFGETTRIGPASGSRIELSDDTLQLGESGRGVFTVIKGGTSALPNNHLFFGQNAPGSGVTTITSSDFDYQSQKVNTTADGWSSRFSVGIGLVDAVMADSTSYPKTQTIFGHYNKNVNSAIFIIGNGTHGSQSNALTLDNSGYLTLGKPLAKLYGGTGLTGCQRIDFTDSSSTVKFTYNGMVNAPGYFRIENGGAAQSLCILDAKLKSSLSTGSSVVLGTLPSGYRPQTSVYAFVVTANATTAGKLYASVTSGGAITLYNYSGTSMTTSLSFNITVTWAK